MKLLNKNLVENMKKNIEGLEKVNKKIEKQQKRVDAYKKEQKDYIEQLREKQGFFKTTPEQYEKIKNFDENIKKLNDKINTLQIEKNIYKNNIYNIINYDFKFHLIYDIEPFFYKNIGEKTKEKIQKFVNDYLKNTYNITAAFYFEREYNWSGKLSYINFNIFVYDSKYSYYNKYLEYRTTLHFDYEQYDNKDLVNLKFINIDSHFIYNYDEGLTFKIIDEPAAEAKKIKALNIKLLAKKEKLLKEFEAIKNENNEMFKNNLYDLQDNYIKEHVGRY